MKKIMNVVGARPNFMKIAPIHRLLQQSDRLKPILVHTGQHYDAAMSKIFFEELQMPEPDLYLGVGSGSHGEQTGKLLAALEQVMVAEKPDLVVVVGDVNSTMAAAIDAAKLWIPVAHVEAGLRSFDRQMPEEINRLVTDALSEFLFVTEESGRKNLLGEGIQPDKIHFVGNVMIDTLKIHRERAMHSNVLSTFVLQPQNYALLTLHRPSSVDDPKSFDQILTALEQIQQNLAILFPIHPRSRKMLNQFGLETRLEQMANLRLVEPLGYLDFLRLMIDAKLVLTDSGGIQEETTVLGVPCVTLRENTERPVTITMGTNTLAGLNTEKIIAAAQAAMNGKSKIGQIPPLWDGQAASRIVRIIETKL